MSQHREKGYTLVETSVVLVVIGLIVGAVVFGTSSLIRSSRLTGAANTLVTDLRYARGISTAQQKTVTVAFNSSGYTVNRVTPAATLITRPKPTGVSYSSSGTATFYPWGLATPVTVTVSNSAKTYTLQLAANGNVTHP